MRILRLTLALLAVSLAGFVPLAHAASDQVVITGGAVVPRGETVDNVVVIDGPVNVAGRVTGEVVAISGGVTISGIVDGNVTAVSDRVVLSSGARVGGDLLYGDEKPVLAPGATVDGKVSDEGWSDLGSEGVGWALRFAFWLAVTLSTLTLGLLLLALAPRAADAVSVTVRERTGAAVAWAAGLFIGIPLLAVGAIATVLGLPFGLGLLLALLPLAAVGYVTSASMLGRRIVRSEGSRLAAFLVGFGVLRVIALVPVLGGLTWVLASAFGLAVLLLAAWHAGDAGRPMRTASGRAPAGQPAT
ncbi:MAG TPA: polymer-forming cytoskeletal protein [Gemmatimonadaceae bacterium]|nr:polymer-forming cytoskeletal protein [Gemmatimonadaceae bacterium]